MEPTGNKIYYLWWGSGLTASKSRKNTHAEMQLKNIKNT